MKDIRGKAHLQNILKHDLVHSSHFAACPLNNVDGSPLWILTLNPALADEQEESRLEFTYGSEYIRGEWYNTSTRTYYNAGEDPRQKQIVKLIDVLWKSHFRDKYPCRETFIDTFVFSARIIPFASQRFSHIKKQNNHDKYENIVYNIWKHLLTLFELPPIIIIYSLPALEVFMNILCECYNCKKAEFHLQSTIDIKWGKISGISIFTFRRSKLAVFPHFSQYKILSRKDEDINLHICREIQTHICNAS